MADARVLRATKSLIIAEVVVLDGLLAVEARPRVVVVLEVDSAGQKLAHHPVLLVGRTRLRANVARLLLLIGPISVVVRQLAQLDIYLGQTVLGQPHELQVRELRAHNFVHESVNGATGVRLHLCFLDVHIV